MTGAVELAEALSNRVRPTFDDDEREERRREREWGFRNRREESAVVDLEREGRWVEGERICFAEREEAAMGVGI